MKKTHKRRGVGNKSQSGDAGTEAQASGKYETIRGSGPELGKDESSNCDAKTMSGGPLRQLGIGEYRRKGPVNSHELKKDGSLQSIEGIGERRESVRKGENNELRIL